jgi:hypothetical protein
MIKKSITLYHKINEKDKWIRQVLNEKSQLDQYLMTKNMNISMNKLDIWHHLQINISTSVDEESLANWTIDPNCLR